MARIKTAKPQQALGANRIVRLGAVACPSVAPCKVVAPKRVGVKIAGKRFGAPVLAPQWIAAGKSTPLRVRLPKGAVERLEGRRAKIAVKVSVLANRNETKRTLWSVVTG